MVSAEQAFPAYFSAWMKLMVIFRSNGNICGHIMCIDSYGVTVYTFFLPWGKEKKKNRKKENCVTVKPWAKSFHLN